MNTREGPNIPLFTILSIGNEKGRSRIYKRLISRNGDILRKCAEKWLKVNFSQSFKKIVKDIDCTYVRYLYYCIEEFLHVIFYIV